MAPADIFASVNCLVHSYCMPFKASERSRSFDGRTARLHSSGYYVVVGCSLFLAPSDDPAPACLIIFLDKDALHVTANGPAGRRRINDATQVAARH